MLLQAENGKTELSLVHFTLTNPTWKPPPEAEMFVNTLRHKAVERLNNPPSHVDNEVSGHQPLPRHYSQFHVCAL